MPSSAAFLFDPNPKATLVRSPEAGVAPWDCDGVSTVDDILEKPGFAGAGDPESYLGPVEEKPEGAGLIPSMLDAPLMDICGAGRVTSPLSSCVCIELLFAPSFFLFLAFSVLPFDNGGGSKNSEA